LGFWFSGGREDVSAREFRNADTIEVNSCQIADIIWTRIQDIAKSCLNEYFINDDDSENWDRGVVGNWSPVSTNYDLLFAKYPSGGAFAPHTDGCAVITFNLRSFYSIIVFLNDIPKSCGGGTRFYCNEALKHLVKTYDARSDSSRWTCTDESFQTCDVEAKIGRLLVFDQKLVHEGIPASSPFIKYILRSDVVYARSPPVCNTEIDREAYRLYKNAEDLAGWGRVNEAIPLFRKAFKMSPELAAILGH